MLFSPFVKFAPALLPINVLLLPLTNARPALNPSNVLSLPVINCRPALSTELPDPIIVLRPPVVRLKAVYGPIAILNSPEVSNFDNPPEL